MSLINTISQQQPPEEIVSFQLAHLTGAPTILVPKLLFVSARDMEYLDQGSFGDVNRFTASSSNSAQTSVAIESI